MDHYDILKEILNTYRKARHNSQLTAYWDGVDHALDPADVEDGIHRHLQAEQLAGVS